MFSEKLKRIFLGWYDFRLVGVREPDYFFRVHGWGNAKILIRKFEEDIAQYHKFHHMEVRNQYGDVVENFCWVPPIKDGLKYLKVVNFFDSL